MDLNIATHNSKNKENYRIENKTFEYSEIKDKAQFGARAEELNSLYI